MRQTWRRFASVTLSRSNPRRSGPRLSPRDDGACIRPDRPPRHLWQTELRTRRPASAGGNRRDAGGRFEEFWRTRPAADVLPSGVAGGVIPVRAGPRRLPRHVMRSAEQTSPGHRSNRWWVSLRSRLGPCVGNKDDLSFGPTPLSTRRGRFNLSRDRSPVPRTCPGRPLPGCALGVRARARGISFRTRRSGSLDRRQSTPAPGKKSRPRHEWILSPPSPTKACFSGSDRCEPRDDSGPPAR